MQKVFCVESLLLFQLLSPLDIKNNNNNNNLEPLTPLRFARVSWTLWWLVTINIPEIFQAFTIFSVWQQIIDNSVFEVPMMVFSQEMITEIFMRINL